MRRAALVLTGPALSLILGISLALARPPSPTPFGIQKTIQVPNGRTAFDLRFCDDPSQLCFVADQTNQAIDIINPKNAGGNSDPLFGAWYSDAVIDAMYAAQQKWENFLNGYCDYTGGHCGTLTWADVIDSTPLSQYPGDTIQGAGFTDDGVHPDQPYLSTDLFCTSNCTGSLNRTQQIQAAQAAIAAQANSAGMTVGQALVSWGLPSTISVDFNDAPVTIDDNPSPPPTIPTMQ